MKAYCVLCLLITIHVVANKGEVTNEDLQKFADANNHLAANLFHRVIKGSSDNVVLCPASLLTGLGIMLYGARGNTQKELYTVLGYKAAGLPNDKVPSTYSYYFTNMLPENDPRTINYTLNCADEVLVKSQAQLYPSYLSEVQEQYPTVKNVDFSNNAPKISDDINSFVREKTNGKVDNLVSSVSPDTSSLLVDAVYFRGNWETPFSAGPLQPFYNGGSLSNARNIQFMQATSYFPYMETDKFQVIELPYIGENVALLVLLPLRTDGLPALEDNITPEDVEQVIGQLHPTHVLVNLPKFSLEYSRDFSKDIAAMGAKSVYDGPADFSGMTSSEDLVVSGTLHKTVLDVTDNGNQNRKRRSLNYPNTPPAYFNADHPFLFAVVDRRNDLFLFLGRVNKFCNSSSQGSSDDHKNFTNANNNLVESLYPRCSEKTDNVLFGCYSLKAGCGIMLKETEGNRLQKQRIISSCEEMLLSSLFLFVTINILISSAQVSDDDVTDDDLQRFADANNNLALSLYPKLTQGNSDNLFYVPLSLMTGLGIMLYGARNNTQQEFDFLRSLRYYEALQVPHEMLLSSLFLFVTINILISSAQVSDDDVTDDDLQRFADANNNLALSLYPKLTQGNSDNLFYVPLSLMTGLGIMLYGARNNTQQELYSALGYEAAGLPIERITSTYHYYLTYLLPQNNPHFPYYTLLCADAVLVKNEAPLDPEFQTNAQNAYDATIRNVHFDKSDRHKNSRINNFVRRRTYGKIDRIVDHVNSSSSALLVDAVFFKGKWETPFPLYWSTPQTFHSPNGEKDVPFMVLTHSFPYYETDEFQALLLPYKGKFLGLLILLPLENNTLSNVEQNFTPEKLTNVLNQLQEQEISVSLPRFKIQYYRDFSEDIKALGAESAYDESADFSDMTDSGDIHVTGTLYKGAIEVDESHQGLGASPSSNEEVEASFLANRPFMFGVIDTRYNLKLALGRVYNVWMILSILFLFLATHGIISSAQVSNDDLKRFADASNNLAASLYPRLINGNTDNIFFCPLSLMTGLGIMLYGARGNTQQELYSVLGYEAAGLPLYKVPSTYNYYFSQMLPENNPNQVNYSLYCADEVLVTDRAPLYSQFQEEAQNLYDSTVQNVNFLYANDVTRGINNFVNQQTYGKINSVVNSVDAFSSALLIDAAFFKGKWETPFPPYLSLPQPFYSPTETKNVPFMQVIHSFPYLEDDTYQALLLPYIGGNIGLLILLPKQQNGLSSLEKNMTPDNIVNVLNQLQSQKTMVLLPKFKFQYYRDFSKDFEALGAESAYDGSGDFSGMTFSKGLAVSGTLHKTALEVDESNQGAGMTVDFTPPVPPTILANHPFMFAVVDRRINLLIFLGRVINV
ncbi:uncharacterized protein [Parasteatoda tepidariorum]|uniref:uncharacterized protein n=1 Tax=Parasteatoda tepidariorum TaxID=114398 RepID=UPI0039BCF070